MKLSENYEVVPDAIGWVLIYRDHSINEKTGKPKKVAIRKYFPTLESALKRYSDLEIHKDGAETVKAVLRSLERVYEAIKGIK